ASRGRRAHRGTHRPRLWLRLHPLRHGGAVHRAPAVRERTGLNHGNTAVTRHTVRWHHRLGTDRVLPAPRNAACRTATPPDRTTSRWPRDPRAARHTTPRLREW